MAIEERVSELCFHAYHFIRLFKVLILMGKERNLMCENEIRVRVRVWVMNLGGEEGEREKGRVKGKKRMEKA